MKRNFQNRMLAAVLSVTLAIALMPAPAWAVSVPEEKWVDYAATAFAGGSGTESDPYQIATAEQLAKLSKDVNDGEKYIGTYFVLTADIDLSAHRWNPIGSYKWLSNGSTVNHPFEGFLDGNDKTISGMVVDERIDQNAAGFFGKIANTKTGTQRGAKDLTIAGAAIYVDESGLNECSGGILAGNVVGFESEPVVFENITVSGSVVVSSTNGYNNIGGMIGYASWVEATNCHAQNVSVSGGSNSGGFVGNDSGSVYENCTATGMVSGSWALGGFVGYAASTIWQDPAGASTYDHCAADVKINGSDWRIGGFTGYAEYGTFQNCVSYGDVNSSVNGWNPEAGGFMGESYASSVTVQACHAAGVVTSASSTYNAGGFVGTYTNGSYTGCSFDRDKNSGLSAAGEGTPQGIAGASSAVVLANICEDYFGGHQYGDGWTIETRPTCTADGSQYQLCERCGSKGNVTPIPATGHKMTPVAAKDATCTEAGNTAYWLCENCGKAYGDAAGTNEISPESAMIPAKGHGATQLRNRKDASCTAEGYTGDEVCTVCGSVLKAGEVIPRLAHDFKDGKCTVCGAVDPYYGQNSVPETGDSSPLFLWAVLLAVSGGVLCAAAYSRKKKAAK